MPLLDHFHPPLSRTHPWRGFHGAWAAAIARLLNAGVLPVGYYAVPFLDREGPVEIDVAALQDFAPQPNTGEAWVPSAPAVTLAVEWPVADEVRVEVFADDGDPRLAAVVELVSPRNKDRERARRAFAAKCAGHLRRGCGVVVVDAVTTRRADLHAELLAELEVETDEGPPQGPAACSYRPIGAEAAGQLQVWPAPLLIGQPLPTLPLWLGDFSVPLNLEASYAAACVDLRIRQAE